MKRVTTLLLATDVLLVSLATLAAFAINDSFFLIGDRWLSWVLYTGVTACVALFVFIVTGINRSVYRFTNLNDYLLLSSSTVVVVLASLAIDFVVNGLEGITRTLPLLQTILSIGSLIVARVAYRLFHARRTSYMRTRDDQEEIENILVVGVNPVADLFIRAIDDLANGQIRIYGVLSPTEHNLRGRKIGTHPILGLLAEVHSVRADLKVHGVDIGRIVITVDKADLSEMDQACLATLEADHGVTIDYFANRLGLTQRRRVTSTDANRPADSDIAEGISAIDTVPQGFYRFGKRLFDVSLATYLLTLLWPLVALVSLIVWFDVGRPLLFWQERPGQGGRRIRVFKFRTMGLAHDGDGNRLADDRRVSAIGTILRARRLDELAQLFNILVGDMSFVGPRPLLPIDQPEDRRDRLRAKPGLTGWAQVMGGRDITAADKAALDSWYIKNMSFALDIEIMLRTIPVVLFGERIDAEAIRKACDLAGRTPDYLPARELGNSSQSVKALQPSTPAGADAQ